jgi:hypothetical protein
MRGLAGTRRLTEWSIATVDRDRLACRHKLLCGFGCGAVWRRLITADWPPAASAGALVAISTASAANRLTVEHQTARKPPKIIRLLTAWSPSDADLGRTASIITGYGNASPLVFLGRGLPL